MLASSKLQFLSFFFIILVVNFLDSCYLLLKVGTISSIPLSFFFSFFSGELVLLNAKDNFLELGC